MKIDQNLKFDTKIYAVVDYRGGDMFQDYYDNLIEAIEACIYDYDHLTSNEQKTCITFDVEEAEWNDDLECYINNGYVIFDGITNKTDSSVRFVVRDREAGNVIDIVASYEAAEELLEQYEDQDKKDGFYEKDFYEIVAQHDSRIKYDKKNTKMISLKLNKKTDAKIIEWLESQDNVQGSIKKILEEYIDK